MKRRSAIRGSTLVEFILALILFLLLLSGLIDATVYFVRFSLLDAATKHAVRQTAATSFGPLGGSAVNCGFLTPYLDDEAEGEKGALPTARNYLRSSFGIDTAAQGIIFRGQIETKPPQITLRAEWPYNCFLCVLTGHNLLISTVHRALLEDRCVVSIDPGQLKCCSSSGGCA